MTLAVPPVEVAIFRKLRDSSTQVSANSARTTAETMSISTQLPDAARPNTYSGYAADITFAPTAPRSASIA